MEARPEMRLCIGSEARRRNEVATCIITGELEYIYKKKKKKKFLYYYRRDATNASMLQAKHIF